MELKCLELNFKVNSDGCLFSQALASTMDLDRDALTWYGLTSKLVLRDIQNPKLRSIIVHLGDIRCNPHRSGRFIETTLLQTGQYFRFHINETLGRLDCAPEPRLLFTR